jgi:tripartite-type tricarboxylate transporter receptor subunit TctC
MVGMSKKIGGPVTAAALLLMSVGANAENFPNKPVHILVPYAAGGAVDVLARTLGQSLAKTWGQQPIIENRPGAGGIVASQALTQAPPDGYTLIMVASGHPLNQFIYPSLPYDTFKDFTAISEIASSPLAILVSKKSPYHSLVSSPPRGRADSLSCGVSGEQTWRIAGELEKYMAGVKIVGIPTGAARRRDRVMAGDIP